MPRRGPSLLVCSRRVTSKEKAFHPAMAVDSGSFSALVTTATSATATSTTTTTSATATATSATAKRHQEPRHCYPQA